MPIARCAWLVPALVAAMAGTAAAQAPTLPGDTLHANFAPHFRLEPGRRASASRPGDTLEAVPGLPGPTAPCSASRRRPRFRRGSPDSGSPEPEHQRPG